MAHDVFISHSSKDVSLVEEICKVLERQELKCWISPRDVTPGKNYAACITEAVKQCRVMVIIFSKNSNISKPVFNEIELAMKYGINFIPFRIEDVQPSDEMDYYLCSRQWLDATKPPLEPSIYQLARIIKDTTNANNGRSVILEEERKKAAEATRLEEEKKKSTEAARIQERKQAETALFELIKKNLAETPRVEEEKKRAVEVGKKEEAMKLVSEIVQHEDEIKKAGIINRIKERAISTAPNAPSGTQTTGTDIYKASNNSSGVRSNKLEPKKRKINKWRIPDLLIAIGIVVSATIFNISLSGMNLFINAIVLFVTILCLEPYEIEDYKLSKLVYSKFIQFVLPVCWLTVSIGPAYLPHILFDNRYFLIICIGYILALEIYFRIDENDIEILSRYSIFYDFHYITKRYATVISSFCSLIAYYGAYRYYDANSPGDRLIMLGWIIITAAIVNIVLEVHSYYNKNYGLKAVLYLFLTRTAIPAACLLNILINPGSFTHGWWLYIISGVCTIISWYAFSENA